MASKTSYESGPKIKISTPSVYYLCIPKAFDSAVTGAKIPPTETDKVIDTNHYGGDGGMRERYEICPSAFISSPSINL